MALTDNLAGRNLRMLLPGIWLIPTGLLPLLNKCSYRAIQKVFPQELT